MVIFQPYLNSVSALPCKTDKHKNYAHAQLLSSLSWCRSQCRKWALLGFSSLSLGYKSTASNTVMFLYRSKCYLLSDMLWVTISSFSRTAHLRIGRVKQSNSCSVKHVISFLQSYAPNNAD